MEEEKVMRKMKCHWSFGSVSVLALTALFATQANQSNAADSSLTDSANDYYQLDSGSSSESKRNGNTNQALLAAAFDYHQPINYNTSLQPGDDVQSDALGCDGGSCCDGCGSSSCRGNCQSRYLVATVEAVFLSPNIRNGQNVNYQVTPTGGTASVYTSNGTDNLYASPRIWLGYQGDCWGAGIRYWNLSSSETSFTPFIPGTSTVGSAGFDRLDMQVLDFEATRRFYRGCNDLTFAIGFRHMEYENQNSVSATQVVGPDLFSGSAHASNDVNANGLTIALSGVRPVGCSGKWGLFWSARGSVLWGDTTLGVQTFSSVVGPGGSAASVNGALGTSSSEAIFVGELQLGLQREYQLKCIPATAFVRGALEYQYWNSNGSGTATSTSGAARPSGVGVANASTASLDMDMIGFTMGAGIYW